MYKFRLFRNDKDDKSLWDKLFVASLVWDHFIALQKRHYRSWKTKPARVKAAV